MKKSKSTKSKSRSKSKSSKSMMKNKDMMMMKNNKMTMDENGVGTMPIKIFSAVALLAALAVALYFLLRPPKTGNNPPPGSPSNMPSTMPSTSMMPSPPSGSMGPGPGGDNPGPGGDNPTPAEEESKGFPPIVMGAVIVMGVIVLGIFVFAIVRSRSESSGSEGGVDVGQNPKLIKELETKLVNLMGTGNEDFDAVEEQTKKALFDLYKNSKKATGKLKRAEEILNKLDTEREKPDLTEI